jgi:fimbrial chaperone protein
MVRIAPLAMTLLLLVPGEVCGGSLGISPTRLELSGPQLSSSVTVRNEGEHPVMVQVQSFAWLDRPFVEDLQPTRDLIAVPPMFRLPPGEKQVIRVARRSPLSGEAEATYRLLISEVPQGDAGGGNGVEFALRLSLPVFAAPEGARAKPQVSAARTEKGLRLTLANNGTAHLRVRRIILLDDAQEQLAAIDDASYVLAGRSQDWDIAAPAGREAVSIKAETSVGDLDIALPIQGS